MTARPSFVASPRLLELLGEAQERGLLGPASPDDHVVHAQAMAAAFPHAPARFLDLGSGGGVPGLVLAELWPDSRAVLLDAAARRCRFLSAAVAALQADDRVEVLHARAEDAAQDPALRETFPAVVARSFGPPAVTAECSAGFLSVDGRLVVSAPPGAGGRWPDDVLAELALERQDPPPISRSVVVFRKAASLAARYPRRAGVPSRRPLWRA